MNSLQTQRRNVDNRQPTMPSSSLSRVHGELSMETLLLPSVVREKLGESASKALIEMFVDAHRLSTASFEQRLAEELSKVRFEIVHARSDMTNAVSNLKFDLLKWCFLFWIGQLAAMTAILGLLLQRVR